MLGEAGEKLSRSDRRQVASTAANRRDAIRSELSKATHNGEQTCTSLTAECSCVPALPPPGPPHSLQPYPPWLTRLKRASGRSLASTASSSEPSRSPSPAAARSRFGPKRFGAIAPMIQETCSHPHSTRLGR